MLQSTSIDDCFDGFSKLMFDISTEVTDDLITNSDPIRKLGIQNGARLFCSNIKDSAFAGAFLSIGTLVKMK